MREVNFQQASGEFEPWATENFRELERASRESQYPPFIDTILDDKDGAAVLQTIVDSSTQATARSILGVPGATSLANIADTSVTNLLGNPNAVTASSYDVSHSSVMMRDPASGATKRFGSAFAIINIATAGPNPLGRDRAAAFSASSYVRLFAIGKDDGTQSYIASANSQTTGPTLPSGYTYWAYLTTVLLNGSGNFNSLTVVRGSAVYYRSAWTSTAILAGGTGVNGSFASFAVSTAAFVPSEALEVELFYGTADTSTLLWISDTINATSGFTQGSSGSTWSNAHIWLPNIAQTIYYALHTTATITGAYIMVNAYRVPNNG